MVIVVLATFSEAWSLYNLSHFWKRWKVRRLEKKTIKKNDKINRLYPKYRDSVLKAIGKWKTRALLLEKLGDNKSYGPSSDFVNQLVPWKEAI
jgi:hypothetical protein